VGDSSARRGWPCGFGSEAGGKGPHAAPLGAPTYRSLTRDRTYTSHTYVQSPSLHSTCNSSRPAPTPPAPQVEAPPSPALPARGRPPGLAYPPRPTPDGRRGLPYRPSVNPAPTNRARHRKSLTLLIAKSTPFVLK
jgi:hypothetical protein